MMAAATTAPPAADPIEAAREEVGRLHRAELDLSDQRMALAASLGSLEAEAGVATLDTFLAGAGTGADTTRRLLAARAEVDALDAAIAEARSRRRDAIRAAWLAEAAPLREQAVAHRAEADAREPRTRELLAALLEHEGIEYAPARPGMGSLPLGDQAGGAPHVVIRRIGRTDSLRLRANDLEAQAAAVEAREVQDRGAISGNSAEAIIAQIRAWEPMKLALPLPAAAEWATQAEAQQRARLARLAPHHVGYGGEPLLELVWAGDDVDNARSRAGVPALDS
jgi:hypothetical protein